MNMTFRNFIAFMFAWCAGAMMNEGFETCNNLYKVGAFVLGFIFYFIVEKENKDIDKNRKK